MHKLVWALVLCSSAMGDWVQWPADKAVPEGSHVRVDLSTGERWLERNATATESLAVTENVDSAFKRSVEFATRQEDPSFDAAGEALPQKSRRETMLSALRKLPGVDVDALSDEELDALWNKRQVELAEAMAASTETASTMAKHLEVLTRFVDTGGGQSDDILAELDALDFELGAIDDARDFHESLEGMPILAALAAPGFPPDVRAAAVTAIGTAIKHDDALQQWTLTLHNGTTCLDLLLAACSDPADSKLQRAGVYALGAALRNNPPLIRNFVDDGGLLTLKPTLAGAVGNAEWPLADKLLTLFADLKPELTFGETVLVCDSLSDALQWLKPARRAERVLRAAAVLAPVCAKSQIWNDCTPEAKQWAILDNLRALAAGFRSSDASIDVQDPSYRALPIFSRLPCLSLAGDELATLAVTVADDITVAADSAFATADEELQ